MSSRVSSFTSLLITTLFSPTNLVTAVYVAFVPERLATMLYAFASLLLFSIENVTPARVRSSALTERFPSVTSTKSVISNVFSPTLIVHLPVALSYDAALSIVVSSAS